MIRKKITVIGGGTGTHTVLRGLTQYQNQVELSAVVTMADSGGSTGRLRDEFGFLPVGDVRMALVALASDIDEQEKLLRQLFLYRFEKGHGLSGHNFGNLLLVALTDILGSEEAAIRAAAKVLRVQGTIVPVTTTLVDLVATYDDGIVVTGEHAIDEPTPDRFTSRIVDLSVTPDAHISVAAKEVLAASDVIILGPGDLYTSVLANCVVSGVADAIKYSSANVVYVCNLMTKVGQTNGFGVAQHVAEIAKYINRHPDIILVNTTPLPEELLKTYAIQHEYSVVCDYESSTVRVIPADLLADEPVVASTSDTLKRSLIRHDPQKLATLIISLL